ncbi:MAG: phenylalanine--tRNA ligase subunit alpha [Gemmatales bacterium]|nr:phenylalanine--tRNA ligase subunit alpha [Gemmatales bacterium]MDW8175461.1 phenylalanine--tRNA ligase subunit alpha [Gemmatales bacterium]
MELEQLRQQALAQLEQVDDEAALRSWNSQFLGKNGALTQALKRLAQLPPQDRPAYGQQVNALKEALLAALEHKKAELHQRELARSLASEALDVTLPGRPVLRGRLHPATQVMRDILAIFAELGFQVYRSREVEDDLTNFELLNMPPHHPARDLWDTFHTTTPGVLLRTHTSPGQIHVMRQYCPRPIRVVLPGMCYRYEQITARSEIQFQQVEGLAIGESISLSDLIGTLSTFAKRFFGGERRIRIRNSYFPFTEPSIEVDVDCILCQGEVPGPSGSSGTAAAASSCTLCKGTGWLEILGAGMVHPVVLRHGGYDPERFQGFAFGMGPQRMAMLKYAIHDIRLFWSNARRFLEQF